MSGDWQPIDTIPRSRAVEVRTVRGLIRLARVKRDATFQNGGYHHCMRGIGCWRVDRPADLFAVAWRERK